MRVVARRLTIFLALALPTAALPGCGGSSSPPPPDPATVVPVSVPFYASAIVRPHGELAGNAVADGRKLSGQRNVYGSLLGALSLRGAGAGTPRADAVNPWLGERAGLFLERWPAAAAGGSRALLGLFGQALEGELFAGAGGGHPARASGALLLDATDPAKARAFIAAQSAGVARSGFTFGGQSVSVMDDGEAAALVGHFLVLGSVQGVKSVIETFQSAAALTHNPAFTTMRANAPANALASIFVATPAPAGSGGSESSATTSESAAAHTAATGGRPGGTTGTGAPTSSTGQSQSPSGGGAKAAGPAALGPQPAWVEALAGKPGSTLYLSLVPQPGAIRLDLDTLPPGPDPPSAGESEESATAQQVFQGLPESSWVAVAVEDLPGDTTKALTLLPELLGQGAKTAGTQQKLSERQSIALLARTLAAAGGSFGSLSTFLAPVEHLVTALEGHAAALHEILSGWIGPAGIFVSGSSLLELNAGLVIASTDASRSRAAVSQLGALLKSAHIPVKEVTLPGAEAAISVTLNGLPVPLQIAAGGGKFVVGVGVEPVQAALTPSATLGNSAAYKTALSTLGEGLEPRGLVSFPQLTSFLNLLGATSSPTYAQLSPYLHRLSTLTIGVGRLGSGKRTSFVLALG
jgi:hypothetical protein